MGAEFQRFDACLAHHLAVSKDNCLTVTVRESTDFYLTDPLVSLLSRCPYKLLIFWAAVSLRASCLGCLSVIALIPSMLII